MAFHARLSIVPHSRRFTKDFYAISTDYGADLKSSRFTKRKTFITEFWLESVPDVFAVGLNKMQFLTGSKYEGQCSKLGMEGVGTYTFPHGVVYEGQFKDGLFHGKGVLIYPAGQVMNCTFHRGKMIEWEFLSVPPSIEEDDDSSWARRTYGESEEFVRLKTGSADLDLNVYCKPGDRRFHRTYIEGFKGAPNENLSNIKTPRKIPEGTYDVGDGFYNPKTKWVHSIQDPNMIMYMIPQTPQYLSLETESERRKFIESIPDIPIYKTEKWILDRCRKASVEKVGHKPELYEYWFSGRQAERDELQMCCEDVGGKFIREESICEESLRHFEHFNEIKWF